MTRSLLKNGDLNVVDDENGYTALHLVARSGEEDVVEALVEAGADVAARSCYKYLEWGAWRNYQELTPPHKAARGFNLGGMSALLRHGADVNAADGNDQTPLHWLCKDPTNARRADAVDAADLLLRWGADESLTDTKDNTPRQRTNRESGTRRLRNLLANAPQDRAWRRRGLPVLYRAFLDKMVPTTTKAGKGKVGKAKARRGRHGRAGGERGSGDVLIRAAELDDDENFRGNR